MKLLSANVRDRFHRGLHGLALVVLLGAVLWPVARPAAQDAQAPAESAARRGRVKVHLANVREGPGSSHAVLLTVRQGTLLDIAETSGQWHRVRTADGKDGWLFADLLDVVEAGAVPGHGAGEGVETAAEPDALDHVATASSLPAGQILNHSTDARYWILQEAIDAAEPGQVLLLGPGRYPGRVVLRKELYLYGAGMGQSILELTRSSKDSVWIADTCPDGLLSHLELVGGTGRLPVLEISGKFRGTIEQCRIRGGRGPGVLIGDEAEPRLRGCELTDTGAVAIEIRGKARPRIELCYIHDTRGGGVVVLDESRPLLVGNRLLQAGTFGMQIGHSAQPTLESNEVRGARHDGVYVFGRAAPTMRQNLIAACASRRTDTACLSFDEDSAGTIVENTVEQCTRRPGVLISENAHPLLQANRIRGNRIGVLLAGRSFATLEGNVLEDNKEGLVDRRKGQGD
jgi:SH3-like domain-containing protein/nitrous oxidase accessory protein NosD